jgi:5-methyltetrahydropteroyltriglutamate--homocysteine methyltransferase
MATRIETTHVGSLVRPKALVDILLKRVKGQPYDEGEYRALLEKSIQDLVRHQAEIGIDIVSDGEFGKSISWSRYVLERLGGMEQKQAAAGVNIMPKGIVGKERRDFADFYAEYDPTQKFIGMSGWVVSGPIVYKGHDAIAADIRRLKAAQVLAGAKEAFIPCVAPSSVAPDREDRHYKSEEQCLFAIAEALHEEYKAVVDAGLILQVDDAYLASTFDLIVPPGTMADYRKWAKVRIDALNHALRGIPEERTRYHVCWGSWNGPHVTDVEIRHIIDLILQVKVGGYSLEMANPRHEHEWRVWETTKLPEGRKLLPGLISHSTNVVEHPELVAQRIVRLARLVGPENVIASTDCGFAQGPFTQRVHESIMWVKLEALVAGARLAEKQV